MIFGLFGDKKKREAKQLNSDAPLIIEQSMQTYTGPRLREMAEANTDVIEDVRGAGLMIGLKCVGDSAVLKSALQDAGLLTVGAGDNVVRLLPPLIIDESHVDEAMDILNAVVRSKP